MRLPVITCVLLACVCLSAGDVAHLKAAKAKLVGRLVGKHHKRGIYTAVPPFKLGHDIPLVSHSVVKPLVVSYPPTASVAAVKVPVIPPYSRFPVSVGHKVHSHFGLKFPHHHTKTIVVPKPDQHFHHHHHHVAPKPVIPVLPATPLVPAPQPTATVVAHSVRAPTPTLVVQSAAALPAPVFPPQPLPIAPPPVPAFPTQFPLKQFVPVAPIRPAPLAPAFPVPSPYSYVIRPGNAVQTSFFASYPRYPLLNYQNSLLPLAAPAAPLLPAPIAPAAPVGSLAYDHLHPQHLVPQAGVHDEVFDHRTPGIAVEPTPTLIHPTQAIIPQPGLHLHQNRPDVHLHPAQPTLHLQPAQPQAGVNFHPTSAVPLDHDGWSPVPAQAHDIAAVQPEQHFPDAHHFTQEQATQVFEHHSGDEQQYHDYQNQLQHHIQHQLEQAQYDQQLHQHQLGNEYGAPQQEYGHPQQEYGAPQQEYGHPQQEYGAPQQEYGHPHEYAQNHDYSEHEYSQQEYAHQPAAEYGLPGGIEGRSGGEEEEETQQRYHNHIPLGLQPPIDRPLEHFR